MARDSEAVERGGGPESRRGPEGGTRTLWRLGGKRLKGLHRKCQQVPAQPQRKGKPSVWGLTKSSLFTATLMSRSLVGKIKTAPKKWFPRLEGGLGLSPAQTWQPRPREAGARRASLPSSLPTSRSAAVRAAARALSRAASCASSVRTRSGHGHCRSRAGGCGGAALLSRRAVAYGGGATVSRGDAEDPILSLSEPKMGGQEKQLSFLISGLRAVAVPTCSPASCRGPVQQPKSGTGLGAGGTP